MHLVHSRNKNDCVRLFSLVCGLRPAHGTNARCYLRTPQNVQKTNRNRKQELTSESNRGERCDGVSATPSDNQNASVSRSSTEAKPSDLRTTRGSFRQQRFTRFLQDSR